MTTRQIEIYLDNKNRQVLYQGFQFNSNANGDTSLYVYIVPARIGPNVIHLITV
jgi:hypothetical protein